MPNAAPVFALLGIGTAIALAAASSRAKTPPPGATVTLDNHLPLPLEEQVLHTLATSQDPTELSALADQLEANGFPLAARALRARAAQLKAAGAGAPGTAAPVASAPATSTPSTALPGLDANLDPTTAQAVLAALSTETDPAKLVGFAHSIEAQYPLAAAALMTKAAGLQAQTRAAQAAQAAVQGVAATTSTTATPAAATTPDTPPTAQPTVVTVPTTPAPNVTAPGSAPVPTGPGAWVPATDADVARDAVAARYAVLLPQAVGTTVTEVHNGRTWQLRVVSKTTDPNLTMYAKDVKGWIWQPAASVGPTIPAPMPAPVLVPVVTSKTMASVPSSPAIAGLQHSLNILGASPPLVEDGINGPKTIAAVKAFQSAHGLTVDGIAGPLTNAAIATALAAGASPAPVASSAPAPAGPMLPAASLPSVVTVQDVQSALNRLGVPSPPLKVDGIAGPLTQGAVKLFQMQHGLTIDGVAGPLTKAALAAALAQAGAVSTGRHRELWRAA
jgi:peptidoglycan hydrolase-like protein with peptidoglycan-binding domain